MECILSISWVIPNWGNWLICWRTKLLFRGTSMKDKMAVRNTMKFNKTKRQVPYLGWKPSLQQYGLGTGQLDSSSAGRALGVLVDELNVSQQQRSSWTSCAAFARVEPASPRKLLFPSIFVYIPHLEHFVQFWASQHKTKYWHIRGSPQDATRNQGLKNIIYEKRLKNGVLLHLTKRRQRKDIITVFNSQTENCRENRVKFFFRVHRATRCTGQRV